MQTRQIYTAITASTAGTVYVELPFNAKLKQICWSIDSNTAPATNDTLRVEISKSGSAQLTVHDAAGVLAVFSAFGYLTTSGSALTGLNGSCLVSDTVKAGERIYLNAVESGSSTWLVRVLLCFE